MKLFFLATFVATVCYVNAGKRQRLLAALNGGMIPGVNGGMIPGVNGGMMGGLNGGMMGGMNGGLANGAIPGMMAGGLNPPMVAAGGAGFFGQPQFAQFVPGVPAFAVPPPVPNVYTVPAVNALPFMGVPPMAQMNPPQQPLPGITGGGMQQQLPVQPDPLRRFRRQIMKQENALKTTVDTQIPAPAETTTTPCDKEGHHEDDPVNKSV
ncbi:secretory calcium-binding phosphoprotein 9 [Micropterus salmoides]|uniref:secretory calcium-binding phosphoprotein 9 n=1 Tax=Micropterus salmoides TaxID=27706 RepID=UPI0018ECD9D1|nr:secretory calcium-binding phosphoprotein 9 [Micropterus salmoides]